MQKLDCKIEVASLKILEGVLAMTPLVREGSRYLFCNDL